ncbi:T9SS type A sorting domain-containing protein [Bacteroides sp.]
MKHNYSIFWLSACFVMCLLLCGNVSAQPITSFEVQQPDFISEPYDLRLMLRTPTSSDTEVSREFPAIYNPETGKYEVHDLESSADYLIYAYISLSQPCTYVLPYSLSRYVTAGGTVKLDLRNVYHSCNVTVKDYYGHPFPDASLQQYPYGDNYMLDQEGHLLFYMPDGIYDFTISASGYSPLRKSITMAGANRDVTFTLDDYRKVTFKVTDHKGDALEYANVIVEESNGSYSVVTNADGEATMFLADGNYNICLSADRYWKLYKKLVVNSTTKTVDLSFEGYRHISFKVKNGESMGVHVSHFYFSTQRSDEFSIPGDSYYAPEGLYIYKVNFDSTFEHCGLIQVSNADIEKTFDFSDYKKAIIECSRDISYINVYDLKKYDSETGEYEPIYSISFPEFPEGGGTLDQSDRTAVVYLPAGEYEINGYNTPQTAMKIQLTQPEQRFVYNTQALNLIDVELNFINSPVDVDELSSSWYAYFVPKGYKGNIYGSSHSMQVPAGEYSYTIEHDGYNGYGFLIKGACKVDADNRVVNVDLKNYHCANFNVLTPDGVEVEYPIMEFFKDGVPFTSLEGRRYLFENGTYRVLVWDEGETEVYQKWVSFTVAGENQNIDVQFERANTSIVFTDVRNEKYEPIENAEVNIAGKAADFVQKSYALFTDIPCGENNYTISIGGIQVQTGTIEVAANETLDMVFFVDSSTTGFNDRKEGGLSMMQYGNKLFLYSEDGEAYSVSIYGVNGNKLLERRMNGNGELSTESFESGVYILRIVKSGRAQTFKFVKK